MNNFFDIALKQPICVDGLTEDALRALVNALQIKVANKDFGGFVLSSSGVQIKFQFGPDGSFQGVFAKLNGKSTTIIPGTTSKYLAVFEGPPSSVNPGVGWEVNVELTQEYLNQPPDQNQWKIFYAKRVSVLNV